VSGASDRLADLRMEARFRRERYELYRAKAYGPRPTSPGRLKELEREAQAAEDRLKAAEASASG
jgi:hypothetical protein